MPKKAENQVFEEKEAAPGVEVEEKTAEPEAEKEAAPGDEKGIKEPDAKKSNKLFVENKKRAGATVFAVTGKPIVFNAIGEAEVEQADYDYLKTVPGYETK